MCRIDSGLASVRICDDRRFFAANGAVVPHGATVHEREVELAPCLQFSWAGRVRAALSPAAQKKWRCGMACIVEVGSMSGAGCRNTRARMLVRCGECDAPIIFTAGGARRITCGARAALCLSVGRRRSSLDLKRPCPTTEQQDSRGHAAAHDTVSQYEICIGNQHTQPNAACAGKLVQRRASQLPVGRIFRLRGDGAGAGRPMRQRGVPDA